MTRAAQQAQIVAGALEEAYKPERLQFHGRPEVITVVKPGPPCWYYQEIPLPRIPLRQMSGYLDRRIQAFLDGLPS